MADRSWEQFGKEDPYYAVLTDPQFSRQHLNEESLRDFFHSGEEHIANVLQTTAAQLAGPASFGRALDFGCGTGRLLMPLARRFDQVTGIDISPGMVEEARKNLQARALSNVDLLCTGSIASLDLPPFDFVHSYIVLQHIHPSGGYPIIDRLFALTAPGGCGMVHFTFDNGRSFFPNALASFKNRYGLTRGLWNIAHGKSFNAPTMQMNNYSLRKIFGMLARHQPTGMYMSFTDHGHLGMCLYYKK